MIPDDLDREQNAPQEPQEAPPYTPASEDGLDPIRFPKRRQKGADS